MSEADNKNYFESCLDAALTSADAAKKAKEFERRAEFKKASQSFAVAAWLDNDANALWQLYCSGEINWWRFL